MNPSFDHPAFATSNVRFPTTVIAAILLALMSSLDFMEKDTMEADLAHVQDVLSRTLEAYQC